MQRTNPETRLGEFLIHEVVLGLLRVLKSLVDAATRVFPGQVAADKVPILLNMLRARAPIKQKLQYRRVAPLNRTPRNPSITQVHPRPRSIRISAHVQEFLDDSHVAKLNGVSERALIMATIDLLVDVDVSVLDEHAHGLDISLLTGHLKRGVVRIRILKRLQPHYHAREVEIARLNRC
jgi:hypothetical protein